MAKRKNKRKGQKLFGPSLRLPAEHKKIIKNYLACLDYANQLITDDDSVIGKNGRELLGLLRQAHIVELPGVLFQRLYKNADRYVMQELLKSDWDSILDFRANTAHLNKAEAEKLHKDNLDQITAMGRNVPLDTKRMPFDTLFIAHGSGVEMTEQQLWPRGFTNADGDIATGKILGHVVSRSGKVVEMIWWKNSEGVEHINAFWHRERFTWKDDVKDHEVLSPDKPMSWKYSYAMLPWVMPEILRAIDDHRTVVVEKEPTFLDKNRFNKELKRAGISPFTPKPFYIVYMEDKLITRRSKRLIANLRRSARTYRSSVREHSRILVCRGSLPLKPRTEKILEGRGYIIFTTQSLDFETYHAVKVRGHVPKQPREWMAVKRVRVKNHIRGPEDAPFIPSVRRSRKLDEQAAMEKPSP